ncbi:hypothetical protein ACIQM0_14375 [Streptomyces sp. NPDC091387]|uniref:hypothetical protein n=1 Tax=Streptomyces sp. NPDC091387 TaxID=3365998 RepID=UPI0038250DF8
MANPTILSVGDDPAVSRAVARDLRRQYGDRYRIVRALSGGDALDALREKHHGDIRVSSEPGDTRFQVCLPIGPPDERQVY